MPCCNYIFYESFPLTFLCAYFDFRDEIYIAPSGVQKERIVPDELFVQDINGCDIQLPPTEKRLKKSQCTPLFMCAYTSTCDMSFL